MKIKKNTEIAEPIIEEKIAEQPIEQMLDDDYMRYAFKVMKDRAIPDAEDGLKPVQRRLLVAMHGLKLSPGGATVKCAAIVGDTMRHFHPHGDANIYSTLCGLVEDWSKRYPLIHGQGNFGNLSGAPAAAYRYTEAKLNKFGAAMLQDLSPDVVPYIPTYDDRSTEPVYLPTALPQLLLNGTTGIAVGLATSIAPHNLRELSAVVKAYIDNPALSTDEILALMPGPDFPTGGVLRGQDGVRAYYEGGRGSLVLDGVYEVEQTEKGNQRIVVTGLPHLATPVKLAQQIVDLAEANKIQGISNLKDLSYRKESGEQVIKVVIDLSRGGNANLIINQLLKSTCLRTNFSVNQTVLIGGKLVENASVLRVVAAFVDHRKRVLTNKYTAERRSAAARVHILDGLINVTKNIDGVVRVIRASDGPEEAALDLIVAGFVQTDIQAKAVLAITLSRLTKLGAGELEAESAKLTERIAWLDAILGSEKKLLRLICKEQDDLAKSLGDERRTQIGTDRTDIQAEDLIPEENVVISITTDGYLRRTPLAAYNVQRRGGKGVIGVGKREGDDAGTIFVASTHDLLLFFTNKGMMYKKKGYEIPAGARTGKGTHVANLLALSADERVTATLSLKSLDTDGSLLMATRGGLIKRTELRDYNTMFKSRGLVAIKLNDGDELAFVEQTDGTRDVFLVTALGKAIRYAETSVRSTGRATMGVQALNLTAGDTIAQMITLASDGVDEILVVTRFGFAKKTRSDQYRCLSGRYAKGVNTIDNVKADRNGLVCGATTVRPGENLLLVTANGKVIKFSQEQVRSTGRTAMGVRAVHLSDGDEVSGIICAPADPDWLREE